MLKKRILEEIGQFLKLKDDRKEITELEMINDDPVTFHFTLLIKEHYYKFELILCAYFPYQPIIIKSLEEKRLSKHQYNDGTMCLKWGIDNWHEELSIRDLVLNLIELLEIENPYSEEHGVAEDGDAFSPFQNTRENKNIINIYISKDELETFDEEGYGRFQSIDFNNTRIGYLESIDETVFLTSIINDRYKKNDFLYKRYKGCFNCEIIKESEFYKNNKNKFLIFIFDDKIYGQKIDREFNSKHELIEFNRENNVSMSEELLDKYDKIKSMSIINFIELDKEKEKRIPLTEEIKNKKISIIGLGSIGSRVLIDLARAGFKKFMIMDDDIFMPYNIIRHELFRKYVGMPKVIGLKYYIEEEIDSTIEVNEEIFALNGQQSSKHTDRVFKELATSDVIIDCTADSNLIFGINEIVKKHDINYVSGSVISGGLGNVLTKRGKGSKITVIDLLESQKKAFYHMGINNFLQNDYSATFGESQYIASMSDCSIIAGLIGKTVINLLTDNDEYPENDIYIMSTSNSRIGPFYTVYPCNGNKRKYRSKRLNKTLVERGANYYNNYTEKIKNINS